MSDPQIVQRIVRQLSERQGKPDQLVSPSAVPVPQSGDDIRHLVDEGRLMIADALRPYVKPFQPFPEQGEQDRLTNEARRERWLDTLFTYNKAKNGEVSDAGVMTGPGNNAVWRSMTRGYDKLPNGPALSLPPGASDYETPNNMDMPWLHPEPNARPIKRIK